MAITEDVNKNAASSGQVPKDLDGEIIHEVQFPPEDIPNADAPVTMGALNDMFRNYLAPVMKVTKTTGYDFKEFKHDFK